MDGEITYEMIADAVKKLKERGKRHKDHYFVLPSPNPGKRLILKNDWTPIYEIYEGKKTADDFDYVEEVDINDTLTQMGGDAMQEGRYDVNDPFQIIRPKGGATDRFMQNIGWCIEQFKF